MDEQSQGLPGPPVSQFQPQKALRPDMGYNTLANFRIEKKIGRGQFSEVYRATCLLDGVPVALKKVQLPHKKRYSCFKSCVCAPASSKQESETLEMPRNYISTQHHVQLL